MKVRVNNQIVELPEGATLADVVKLRVRPHPVFAVEHNRQVTSKRVLGTVVVREGDEINIVEPVGGG